MFRLGSLNPGFIFHIVSIFFVLLSGSWTMYKQMKSNSKLFLSHRSSPMSASGTIVRNLHVTEHTETQMIPATEDTRFASSVTTVTWITMNCLSTYAGTTTTAISVTQMVLRNTTGKCFKHLQNLVCFFCFFSLRQKKKIQNPLFYILFITLPPTVITST